MSRLEPPRKRSQAVVECFRLLAAAVALAGTPGCGDGDARASFEQVSTAPAPKVEPEATGSMSFALTLPRDVKLDAFSYVITGPNFSRSGSIQVSKSTTVSALIEGIPETAGYSVTLMGTLAPPATASCSGSATFSVTAGEVTPVPVSVACHLTDAVAPPAAVPLPPLAPIAAGFALLVIGSLRTGRRRERSG